MPVQAFFDDRYLVEKGSSNYWGYNTIAYFAPAPRYASVLGDVHEFKVMVHRLHEAGIEVILDVVYNHTAEGNHLGPTLSFRGIDNAELLSPGRRSALLLRHDGRRQHAPFRPSAGHADGHRLTALLGRDLPCRRLPLRSRDRARPRAAKLRSGLVLLQCPPPGPGAVPGEDDRRAVGPWRERLSARQLPPGWAEWNGRYRDDMRSFWKGDDHMLPALARGILGSADMFDRRGRRPWASINFITAHDGFTLADLWSYNDKHNEANKENNRRRSFRQSQLELRCRGQDRRPGDPRPARPHAPLR